MEKRAYIAIDLKSFYASVECIDRGLDPMRTHLVVADASRTEKTICLAVSPSLKTLGIPGRAAAAFRAEADLRRFLLGCGGAGGTSRMGAELSDRPAANGALHRRQHENL